VAAGWVPEFSMFWGEPIGFNIGETSAWKVKLDQKCLGVCLKMLDKLKILLFVTFRVITAFLESS